MMNLLRRYLLCFMIMCLLVTAAACIKPEVPDSGADSKAKNPPSEGKKDGESGLIPMPDADDPITFRIFVRDPGAAPSKSNPVLNKITELTGVAIEFEFLTGDLAQRQGMMIASEDYPDAIFAEVVKFIDAGALIPIGDKLKNYPNLQALYAPFAQDLIANDGKQYILELYSVTQTAPIFTDNGPGFFIQKAVLEESGYPIPRTLEEYFRLIGEYKTKHPQIDGISTVGFEILCDGWRDFCLLNPPQHLMGAGNDGNVYVDPITYTATLYQTSDTSRNYYGMLNEQYHKGIIEAETFTQNYDQYISKLSSGAVLGFFDQGWNFIPADNFLKTEKKYNRTYVAVPIANPGVRDSYLDAPNGRIPGINGIGITKRCKNPDRLLAFYDWMLQQDVQNYLQWGLEGLDYTKLDNGGKVLTAERREINNDDAKKRDLTGYTLWNYSPKHQGLYENGEPCGPSDSDDEYLASLSPYDRTFLENYGIRYPAQLLSAPVARPEYYPVWAMVFEEGSSALVAANKMTETCRKYYPRLILSEPDEFDGLWNEFVKEIENGDPQPYLDEVNKRIRQAMNR